MFCTSVPPFCTSPYLSGLESHLGPVLHVSVPALQYVSVPAQLLLARLHVSVLTSCSDFDLTFDKVQFSLTTSTLKLNVTSTLTLTHLSNIQSLTVSIVSLKALRKPNLLLTLLSRNFVKKSSAAIL